MEYVIGHSCFQRLSSMDTTMEADLSSILSGAKDVDSDLNNGDTSDIVGMLVMDDNGLVVGVQGEVGGEVAPVVQDVVRQSSKLQEDGDYPVIVITTQSRKLLIKREDKITTAIIKNL